MGDGACGKLGSSRCPPSCCLTDCANAVDPTVSLIYQGSHADNFNDLYAAVAINDDVTAGACNDWATKLVAKFGEDYVVDLKFNDGDNLDDEVSKDFAPSVRRSSAWARICRRGARGRR